MALPEVQDLDLDSPAALPVHRAIIRRKKLLRRLYEDYYESFRQQALYLAAIQGKMLELGSGPGFLREFLPDVITSDICPDPAIDRVIDASRMPFQDRELKGIFMMNVLHHLPDVMAFFREASRCLVPGGRIVMIEPHNSFFGRILYKRAHHEPFDETAKDWTVRGTGRLTGANQALPWIIFTRDRLLFEKHFPELLISSIDAHTVTRFVVSGGLTWRQMAPSFTYSMFRMIDQLLSRFPNAFPLFQTIILERR
jgi:SAM-dependent methyltransferase